MEELTRLASSWPGRLAILAAILAVVTIGHATAFFVARRLADRSGSRLAQSLIFHCRLPSLVILLLLVLQVFLPLLGLPVILNELLKHILAILLIATVAWLAIKLTNIGEDLITTHYDLQAPDNLAARKIHTQYLILRKVVIFIVTILSLAAILMTFDKVRQLGAGILASAGIIGLILGFAAQRTLATLFAGIQIAISQPIRLDDVVIVEGEWGRVEEITLTYVVVRVWDLRRLVVPITYFIEKPFQNWTRVSADLLGTVYVYTDPTVPVDALRAELKRIVENSDLWDGKVCGLQVTNATERSVELRALVSAADSSKAWELRCQVRENLIDFIQKKHPQALPRFRADIQEMTRD